MYILNLLVHLLKFKMIFKLFRISLFLFACVLQQRYSPTSDMYMKQFYVIYMLKYCLWESDILHLMQYLKMLSGKIINFQYCV